VEGHSILHVLDCLRLDLQESVFENRLNQLSIVFQSLVEDQDWFASGLLPPRKAKEDQLKEHLSEFMGWSRDILPIEHRAIAEGLLFKTLVSKPMTDQGIKLTLYLLYLFAGPNFVSLVTEHLKKIALKPEQYQPEKDFALIGFVP